MHLTFRYVCPAVEAWEAAHLQLFKLLSEKRFTYVGYMPGSDGCNTPKILPKRATKVDGKGWRQG